MERGQLGLWDWGRAGVLEGLELMVQAGVAPALAEDVKGSGREGQDDL